MIKSQKHMHMRGKKTKKIAFNSVAIGSLIWILVIILMYVFSFFDSINHGNLLFVLSILAFTIGFFVGIQRNQVIVYENGIIPSWLISLNIRKKFILFNNINKIYINGVKGNYSAKIIMNDGGRASIDRFDLSTDEWDEFISILKQKSDEYSFNLEL